MCGIAGFKGDFARSEDADLRLAEMTAALAHRGPDGQSRWLGPDVGLGHTRLAIVDLGGGAQPMWSAYQRHVIVFNGEIYNYRELREELLNLGHELRTRSDTEVIWAAINAWGIESGLLRLRGMFAFALYDVRECTLLVARDRVGIKPLFLARVPGGVAFASEPKALLTLPQVRRRLNPAAIHDYLATGYATSPATCFADIEILQPGCWIEFSDKGERSGRFWNWLPRERKDLTLNAAVEKAESILRDSLKFHLVADVPVGAFLSGGLDSSLITALLSGNGERIRTFSVGFGDAAYDETQFARQVAQKFDTEHQEIRVEAGEGDPDLFRAIVDQFDEPFGDSSAIPMYLMCREVRKSLKVVLSGDGGDEVLGGYPRYLHAQRLASLARLNGFLPRLQPIAAIAETRLGSPGRQMTKAWRFAQLSAVERMSALQSYFLEEHRRAMYQPDFAQRIACEGTTAQRLSRFIPAGVENPAQQMIAAEIALRLHADYLRKVDVASSAHGLEVRVPYLDARMLELGAELPFAFKIARNGETKILSRRLASRYLPDGFGTRPKQGFSIPLDRWSGPKMREFFRSLLLDRDVRLISLIQPRAIREIWDAFNSPGSLGVSQCVSRYQRYQRLFMLVSLELWLRRWSPGVA